MSGRIAHRPHYRISRRFTQPSRGSQKDYLHSRWVYRQQHLRYEKPPLGHGLSLIPYGYRLIRGVLAS